MKNSVKQKSNIELNEEDILSLNTYQLVILFFLSIRLSETVRYSLLQDMNKYIFPNAKLSASSFYNTLDRLEHLGLVETSHSSSGRVKNVRGTSKIKQALEIVSKYSSVISFNPEIIYGEYLPIFNDFIKIQSSQNALFIDLDEFFDVGLTSLLKIYPKELFVLADNESFEKYKNRSTEQIFQTQIINGKIREPDKIFDVIFIMDFQKKDNFYGMNEKTLLEEAIRVSKTNGLIVILGTEDFPITNNIVLDSIAENLKKNPFMSSIDKQSFIEIITSTSPVKPDFYTSKGFLISKLQIK